MPESVQPVSQTPVQPMARPAPPSPMQRANYGIPPRQAFAAPVQATTIPPRQSSTPQMTDVVRPASPTTPPVTPQVSVAQPVATAQPAAGFASSAPTPLFTPRPAVATTAPVKKASKFTRVWPIAVLTLAGLLCLLGGARWVTAGSTAGHNIAVGAVNANDGRTMTIQFTADDGKMHKFNQKSSATMIPGTAVQVAYRSGAPEASAEQVALIKQAHNLGALLFGIGVVAFIITGIITLAVRARHHKTPVPLTTPVTI